MRIVMEHCRQVQGQCGEIVSIEMFAAVGFEHCDEFFGMCDRVLTPERSMFLHTITLKEREIAEYRGRVDWI